MTNRPVKFEDIVGHNSLTQYFENHLKNRTLPQFLILEGPEGLGKTTFAKLLAMGVNCKSSDKRPCYTCASCKEVAQKVIVENIGTENVLLFNMSYNGGKEAAKEVVSNLTLGLSGHKTKVIILDEAHAMSEAAQDTFLVQTEYLPEGIHLILATTNTYNLAATLKSRAVTVHLHPLKQAEVLSLLKREVANKNLTIQGGDATLNLIAAWAEGKPRIALNLLEGFGNDSRISAETVRDFIGFIDLDEILPLIRLLCGSMTHGLAYISEMRIHDSILDTAIEILKIKKGQASYKMSFDDARKVREAVESVTELSLVKFIYELAAASKINKTALIAAFIKAHDAFDNLFKEDKGVLQEELSQKSKLLPTEIEASIKQAPTLSDLLNNGEVIV
jgi:DNA polymerase III delta prime subunit